MTEITLPVSWYRRNDLSESSKHLISFNKTKYSSVQRGMSGTLVDRTKTIDFHNGQFEFPNLTPIPKITTPLSIEECIEESVFKLFDESKDEEIYICWSGGIDSTVALLGCWKYCRDMFLRGNVTVLHSISSTLESPSTYEWILRNNIKTLQADSVMQFIKGTPGNPIYVTGEIGDQIMGNFYNMETFPHLNDEENFLSKDIFSFLNPIENKIKRNQWEEFAHVLYDNRITEIETVFDLLSYANFICKYENAKYRIWLSIQRKINQYNFYDTKEFQNWSLNNNWRQKCNGNWWTKYKMSLKKFIYNTIRSPHSLTMYKQGSLIKDHRDELKERRNFYIDKYLEVRNILDD